MCDCRTNSEKAFKHNGLFSWLRIRSSPQLSSVSNNSNCYCLLHKWPFLVECPQFLFWHYSPQFCQDRGVELLRDLYKIQYWPHSHLIVQWFPPICQNAKNSAPIVSRLKFSSSHVSFVSLATVLSLGTGPDPLHFRQKPSVFFTKQCTLSNLWEPARQNVTSLVLCSISVDENISLAFAVKFSLHWKVIKHSK